MIFLRAGIYFAGRIIPNKLIKCFYRVSVIQYTGGYSFRSQESVKKFKVLRVILGIISNCKKNLKRYIYTYKIFLCLKTVGDRRGMVPGIVVHLCSRITAVYITLSIKYSSVTNKCILKLRLHDEIN